MRFRCSFNSIYFLVVYLSVIASVSIQVYQYCACSDVGCNVVMAATSPNITSNTSLPLRQETSWVTVSSAILVTINLICNTLVCIVVLRHKQMRTPMNYLLVNLAISDVTVGIFIVPQYVLRHAFRHPESIAGDMLCKFVTGGSFIWIGRNVTMTISLLGNYTATAMYCWVARYLTAAILIDDNNIFLMSLSCSIHQHVH